VWFDYDRDGHVDLFLPNGVGQANALYHNNGDGTFTDRAAQAGLAASLGAGGGLAADLDNDGDQELVVLSDGNFLSLPGSAPVRLYRNNGDGTFTDATAVSGVTSPEAYFSAAAGDVNNDGYLDLFITGSGSLVTGRRSRNRLLLNQGNLTFTDVSATAGVDTDRGACVATFSYYDQDPWIDLFVGNCNDQQGNILPMELFRNNGDGTFTDVAARAGLDDLGFWMGLAFGDYDNDGDVDLFVSNAGEAPPLGRTPYIYPHGFFRNNGDGTYTNLGLELGLDRHRWGWGNALRDFNNDGHLDLFFTGALPNPFGLNAYLGPNGEANYGVLWANRQDGTWNDVSTSLPHDFRHEFSSGVAAGDFDEDGFEDLVVMVTSQPPVSNSGQPVLLHNVTRGSNHWLKVHAVGTVSNRDGVGARVTVRSGGLTQLQEIYAGSSLASMHSQTLTFGLGANGQATVDVLWPSGFRNRVYDVGAGETIDFPEIPCSFDDPALGIALYTRCVTGALARLRDGGLVQPSQAGRLLSSALRAYRESH
jgi:enediyne biosynthesis protein E4